MSELSLIMKKYHAGFNDCWQFMKDSMSGDLTDQGHWDKILENAIEISNKHENELIHRILIEITNELERIQQERRRAKG